MKTLGILTADFSVYYDLVQAFRQRGIPFESLAPDRPVPLHVGVVVTSAAEAALIEHPQVVAHDPATPEETVAEALRLLHAPGPFRTCVIGVDPGERPGVAVVADGRVLRLAQARAPEAVHALVRTVIATLPAERFIVRVGNGAPTFRDRILQAIASVDATLELVDERRSTPVDHHGPAERDTVAATNIALTPGTPLARSDLRPARPTAGELRDIQRKSRLASEGMVTITRALARHVALGHMTIDEAVSRMRPRA